jgi:hypothetical protein
MVVLVFSLHVTTDFISIITVYMVNSEQDIIYGINAMNSFKHNRFD